VTAATGRRPAAFALPVLALLAAMLALHLAAFAAAAEEPVIAEYNVDAPSVLTVGDRFGVTIVVEADTGTRVEVAPGGIPADVSLAESVRFSSSDAGGGRTRTSIELVLAPFLLGDYQMPPITLRYRDPTGATGELQTPPARILIQSTLPAGQDLPEPRDLKPQAVLPSPAGAPYELVVLAGAALALALALTFIVIRRLQRPLPAFEAAPPLEALGPEDAARALLDEAGAGYAATGDQHAYYATISRAVRTYLTDRFGFPAFALTTVELQGQMVFRGMDRWQARLVAGLLEQCDSVMYAGYAPAGERADADLTAAYEIVEMSRPREEPEAVAV
jgi:hypothetical protein